MKTVSILLVAIATLAVDVLAQRFRSSAVFGDESAWRYFLSQEYSGQTGAARWWWRLGGVSSSGTVAIPFQWAGGATYVGDETLLVSGWDGSEGWLAEVHFSLAGGVITPAVTTASIGALDLVNPVYDASAGLLYGVDNDSREMLVATYFRGFVLGPWQVVTAAAQCPPLSQRNSFFHIRPLGVGVGAEVLPRGELSSTSRLVVRDVSGAWSVIDPLFGHAQFVPVPAWIVGAFPLMTISSTEYQVVVAGGAGPFSIIDAETGAGIFQGVHSGSPSTQVFSIPASSMQSGRLYYVDGGSGSGIERSSLFRAENVWRRASVDPNMVPAKLGIRTDFPAVGTDFVSWELYWRWASAPAYQDVLLTMVVGAWDFGFNPTVPFMGLEILAVPYGDLGAQLASWNNRGVVSFGWAIDINNPALVGLKVAVQAIGALPTGQFIVSDTVGVQLVQ